VTCNEAVKQFRKRKWLLLIGGLLAGAILAVVAIEHVVGSAGEGRIYTSTQNVPPHRVALVLGTSPKIVGGSRNLFFERRMDAATDLWKSGKVKRILVSGDNGTRQYNEPLAMKRALIKRGVPREAIVCDYAGFRTLDSVVRAKLVFDLEDCTIVTDDFHLPRALYIADQKGLNAVGFQTRPLPISLSPRTHLREFGARLLIWMECNVTGRAPKALGPKEPI
jgi:SanA protein